MQAGDVLDGRFALEVAIGAGGMGRVFRAVDRHDGSRVAVKTLRWSDEEHALRFEREAKVLAKLAHPTIVGYRGHGQTANGELYLAMEWLEGEDLAVRLSRGSLPIAEVLAIGHSVTQALALSHAHGVVHRDIKPSNLFVTARDGSLKVLDFGLAHVGLEWVDAFRGHDPLTRAGTVIGTIGYLAPEVAQGSAPDARSDLFSLGAVLFEALTATRAFPGNTPFAVLAKLVTDAVPPVSHLRPDVPPALDDLVGRLLAKEPADRPASALEVASALRPGAAARPATTAPRSAIGDREQRLVAVVLARAPALPFDATAALPDANRIAVRLEPIRARHDARLSVLGDGSVVASIDLAGELRARCRAAGRLALALAGELSDCSLALAAGRATSGPGTPVGQVIDRASSVLDASPPGAIRVDAATATLLRDVLEVREEEGAYVLAGDLSETGRPLVDRTSLFVGRDRELEALLEWTDEAATARAPHAALVVGVAGSGKSRLCLELSRALALRGARATIARASGSGSESAPYAAIRELVRTGLSIDPASSAEDARMRIRQRLSALLPADEVAAVAAAFGAVAGVERYEDEETGVGREVVGDRVRRAFVRWLGAASLERPVILWVEDADGADRASLDLLRQALDALDAAPILVLATTRPEGASALDEVFARTRLRWIDLGPLSPEACAALVRDRIGESLAATRVSHLIERSGGNPFFLEELIRSAGAGTADALPDTIASAIEARIASLDANARRVLRAASVLGDASSAGALAALTDLDARSVATAREALLAADLLSVDRTAGGPGVVGFRSSLVKDAAYAMLTPEDRRQAHRLAAAWLEATDAHDSLALAEHFERGGDAERMAHALLHVVYDALVANDLDAAARHAQRALEAGARGGVRGMLLLHQAEAHLWGTRPGDALLRASEAIDALPAFSSEWCDAVAVRAEACMLLGEGDDLEAWIRRLRAVDPSRRASVRAHERTLARVALMAVQTKGSALGTETLVELAGALEARGESGTLLSAQVMFGRSIEATLAGHSDRAARLLESAAEQFAALDYRRWEIIARSNAAGELLDLGAYEEALATVRSAHAIARSIGVPYAVTTTRLVLAVALGRTGQYGEAMGEAERVLAEARALGGPRSIAGALAAIARFHYDSGGDLALAERFAREALEQRLGPQARCGFAAILARILLAGGRREECLALTTEALALGEAHGFELNEGLLRLTHARALYAVGEVERAKAVLATARARLLERARHIARPEYMKSFFERVSENAETLALAADWGLATTR